ncbi:unnamed protein product [Amoebophrya sp. A120]|nr:unnamed protein product [Amoebophrya sp. A120]|eukprot:GSA120T00003471001.1
MPAGSYDGFWLHPAVELRDNVLDKDGGRGVFVKRDLLEGQQELQVGTLVLAETTLLHATSYEKLVQSMNRVASSTTTPASSDSARTGEGGDVISQKRPLLEALHPVGKGRHQEKISHNWHQADNLLSISSGEIDKRRWRNGAGRFAREIEAIEEKQKSGSSQINPTSDGENSTSLTAYLDHQLSLEQVKSFWSGDEASSRRSTSLSSARTGDVEASREEETGDEAEPVLGLWPTASLINHNFTAPNVARSFCKIISSTGKTESRTSEDPPHDQPELLEKVIVEYRLIRKVGRGEEILDNYLDLSSHFKKRQEIEVTQHRLRKSGCKPDALDHPKAEEFQAAYTELSAPCGDDHYEKIQSCFGLLGVMAELQDMEEVKEKQSSCCVAAEQQQAAKFSDETSAASPGSSTTCSSPEKLSTSSKGPLLKEQSSTSDDEHDGTKSDGDHLHGDAEEEEETPQKFSDPAGYFVFLDFAKTLYAEGFADEAVNTASRALDVVLGREPYSFHSCQVLCCIAKWLEEQDGGSPDAIAMKNLRDEHLKVVFGPGALL